VWFALYQALNTAVELYHTPFGPLIPDLSAPDPWHIIPIVLGASSFLQMKLMPMTGGDPRQQKMMQYMMPAIFLVMMFFLPAGLGIYFLTNTWLGIGQQVLTERYYKAREEKAKQAEQEKGADGDDGKVAFAETRAKQSESAAGNPGGKAKRRGSKSGGRKGGKGGAKSRS